jgi:transcriptional regulator with PAS, ATPase and Fis domain
VAFTGRISTEERERQRYTLSDLAHDIEQQTGYLKAREDWYPLSVTSPFSKLLSAIENKRFRRLGGVKDLSVDVRFIAATNKDLEKMIKEEAFREDLYYRLNVIPLQMPSLRERIEDIPVLAKHFIEKYSREFAKEIKTISTYALELLMKYPFPGNIRELENIIERIVILTNNETISIHDLPEKIPTHSRDEQELLFERKELILANQH